VWRLLLLLLTSLVCCALPVRAAEVRVLAASSLTDALRSLVVQYGDAHPETPIVLSFGASGALAQQVIAGAPADLYLSASARWTDVLESQGLLVGSTRRELAGNDLVFVASPEVPVGCLADLSGLRRIAVGSPASVPAGQYAEQVLRHAGLYQALFDAGRLVFAKDVRQALVYADRGEVDGAFVYATDVRMAQSAVIRFTVPAEVVGPVTYPMALTPAGMANPAAVTFFAYLKSQLAQTTLARYGFRITP
jgi:molybdate transport system substrate-binding protein